MIIDKEKRQILLKEYEICQQNTGAEYTRYWTIFGIFVSINAAIIGGLAYGIFNTAFINEILKGTNFPEIFIKLTMLTILFATIILITIFLQKWLKRTNYLIQNNYKRIHELEIDLNMFTNLRIYINDKWNNVREKLNYKKNPCKSQNIAIWMQVWKELQAEIPQEQFNLLYGDKQNIENIIEQTAHEYRRPNRVYAMGVFWGIRTLWLLAFLFLWVILLYPYINNKIFILYGIFLAFSILDFAIEYRGFKGDTT